MPDTKPVPLQPGEGVIRCPAVRSLIKDGKLKHEGLQTAAVEELVSVLSGQPRHLAPNEAGSLANVAGFFAILNHGMAEGAEDAGHGLMDSLRSLFQGVAMYATPPKSLPAKAQTACSSYVSWDRQATTPEPWTFSKTTRAASFKPKNSSWPWLKSATDRRSPSMASPG
jgi:hypothetical protein